MTRKSPTIVPDGFLFPPSLTNKKTPRPPVPHNGTETSREAAKAAEKSRQTDEARIVGFLRGRGPRGAICEEAAIDLGLRMSTASARFNGIAKVGIIMKTGEKRLTTSNCKAAVWRLANPKNGVE
jgi:hypothetical protein